jgi:AcrR family transcriptional regulator
MAAEAITALEPRKMPVQARSAGTVEAISEATIQVLLSHGAERLTTARVAERTGVSVGTLSPISSRCSLRYWNII